MKLYHGTNIDFSEIDLSKCKPNKDFGQGFYLTNIEQQAEKQAVRRCNFEGSGTPIVQTYEFNEGYLTDKNLNIKIFESMSEEWVLFILENRLRNRKHNYDIVVGPVADDGVVMQLHRYEQHFIDEKTLVKELTFSKVNSQYFFGSERAIKLLKRC